MRGKSNRSPSPGRREFLTNAAALGAAALPAGAVANSDLVPPSMKQQGRPILNPPYGVPSRHEGGVVRTPFPGAPMPTASASFTPLQSLHGIITPSGLVFERHHGGVPDIAPDDHRLLVHGLVERPLVFTMDELTRFPSVSRIHFLECSGNGQIEWTGAGATVQRTHGLVSCCEWTGVPLSTILDEVGLDPKARWLLAEGADAAAMTRSIPIERALDDALLVYAQNGEMLRPEQGYPLRLLMPGLEGNVSVKWLHRLKAAEGPFMTREETSKYTDLLPDGTARQFTLMMETKSVIVRPSGTQRIKPGLVEIYGFAWSGYGSIRRVEVSVDGGNGWQDAQLQEPVLSKSLTVFRLPWRWNGEPMTLQSRASDDTGYVQPTREALIAARGSRSYYHYNGIHSWKVRADGVVESVHA
jgi:sulfane dehydrogenase subunit SoxC